MFDINEQDDFYLHSEHGDIINHDTPDGKLAQDAPLLLEHVNRLTKTLELIGKNMEYDPWMHTLIKEVIGYEKVIE